MILRRLMLPLLLAALLAAPAAAGAAGTPADPAAAAEQAFQRGDFKKAVKEYKKLAEKYPNNVSYHFRLGQAYLKKGELDLALAEFIRTTNLDPRHEAAFQYLGDYFAGRNNWPKAIRAFESLADIDPGSARYHLQLAKACQLTMQNDLALTHFYRVVQINPAIEDAYAPLIQLLQKKIMSNPADPDPLMDLGHVYNLHREPDAARRQFQGVIQMRPARRDAWEELLAVCRELRDCRGEIEALEGLRQFDLKDMTLVDQIVAAARGCELPDVAIRYLELKATVQPDNARLYADLGRLYEASANRIQAYFNFRKYTELCPDCPDRPEYRRWCENEELADPAIDARYRAFNCFQDGVAAFRAGRFPEALRRLEEARGIYAGFAQVHFYLGQTLEELDRRGEALFAYKEAIRLQPANAGYWYILGVALHAEKRLADAATCFRKVQEVDPQDTSGYLNQAQKMLQSYTDQGIIKPETILDKGR